MICAHAAARLIDITRPAWDQVHMTMHDGLPCRDGSSVPPWRLGSIATGDLVHRSPSAPPAAVLASGWRKRSRAA
jgi:hypothetical protein